MPSMTTTEQPAIPMQGVAVPASSVNAAAFFQHTRRQTLPFASNRAYGGLGTTDTVVALQTGIIAGLSIRITGNVVVTLGGRTCAATGNWPYGLAKNVRFTANGQSNLINVSGPWLKAREMMRSTLVDRGVRRQAGGASGAALAQPAAGTAGNFVQGSLSLSNEVWGLSSGGAELGPNVSAIVGAPTTYNFELHLVVPIAFDEITLVGSIFAQTQATELALSVDWANTSDIFVLTGAATAAVSANYTVEGIVYDIPQVGGQIIVPNLSLFHSFVMTRNLALGAGDNEYTLPGQGVGKQLMRVGFRTFNAPGTTFVPMALALPTAAQSSTTAGLNTLATNYGQVGWRYGGNQTPDLFVDGRHLAFWNERTFGEDYSSIYGMGWLDFASDFALRDSVDEGTATQLRLLYNIANAVTLTNPYTEVVQETLFGAAAGG